jgi:hypothetical protein
MCNGDCGRCEYGKWAFSNRWSGETIRAMKNRWGGADKYSFDGTTTLLSDNQPVAKISWQGDDKCVLCIRGAPDTPERRKNEATICGALAAADCPMLSDRWV